MGIQDFRFNDSLLALLTAPIRLVRELFLNLSPTRNRYESLHREISDVPKNFTAVRERSRQYNELFDPYIDMLTNTYGDPLPRRLRHYCFAEPASAYRAHAAITRVNQFGFTLFLAAVIADIAWVSIREFVITPGGLSISKTLTSLPPLLPAAFDSILAGLGALAVVILIILYSYERTRYEPTRIFRRALGGHNPLLFNPIIQPEPVARSSAIIMITGLFAICIDLLYFGGEDSFWSRSLLIYGPTAMVTTAFVLIGTVIGANSRFLGTWRSPDLVAFSHACAMLWAGRALTEDIEVRRYLAKQIDLLADEFQRAIPRMLSGGNAALDANLIQFYRISLGLRSLKTWVVYPQSDTAAAFTERAAIIAGAIVSNAYHYLIPTDDSILPPVPARFRTKLFAISQNIAIGLLPTAGLITAKILHVQLSPQLETSWTIAAILWIIVSVLVSQPDLKDRIAATKDLAGVVAASTKKSD